MTLLIRWLAGLAAGAALVGACASGPAFPADADPFGANWEDRSMFETGLVGVVPDHLAEATVYHIDVVVGPDLEKLDGREWIAYTNREAVDLDAIYLQLSGNATGSPVTVTSVTVAGAPVTPVPELGGIVLRVPLQELMEPGEQTTLRVDFAVELSQDLTKSHGVLGHFDEFLLLDGFYPAVLVHDDEGWNAQNLVPIGDATYLDASWYLVRFTGPSDLKLVASGSELERTSSGRNQIVTFAAGPARDFYLAAAPDWESVQGWVEEIAVNSYGRAEDRDGTNQALQAAVRALALFDEQLGPYPYSEFDIVGTPMRALGIEYPGMTSISLAMYDLEAEVAGLPAPIMLEGTVAHEVAHQWFYNVVGNDQLDEPWLDEALAQYLTGLYYREVYGDEAEEQYRQSWTTRWDRVEGKETPIGRSTAEYSAEEYSPIVYGRGPLFLVELEDLMGREGFAAFLREYIEFFTWDIATSDGFRSLAEQHCGCDLTDMFAEWVYG
jgi:hypothetical protein